MVNSGHPASVLALLPSIGKQSFGLSGRFGRSLGKAVIMVFADLVAKFKLTDEIDTFLSVSAWKAANIRTEQVSVGELNKTVSGKPGATQVYFLHPNINHVLKAGTRL